MEYTTALALVIGAAVAVIVIITAMVTAHFVRKRSEQALYEALHHRRVAESEARNAKTQRDQSLAALRQLQRDNLDMKEEA